MAPLLDLLPDLVDKRTGIVREVTELCLDDDDPQFAHYLSRACDTEAFGFPPNFANNGGAAADPYTAVAKAVGEAVERYCAAIFDYDDLLWSSYQDLGEPATPPGSFALYSPSQYATPGFPWRPFTEDSPVAWVRGRSLVTGDTVLVPAAFVHVPFHFTSNHQDTPICQPISTGLACGSSVDDATVSALSEVIERDAFTIMWHARLSGPRIRLDSLPGPLPALVDRFHAAGLVVHMVDIGTDIRCPTILTVAEGFAQTSPALAFAAAAHPDPVVAARKSLEELAHTRKYAAQVMDYLPPVPIDVEAGHPEVRDQRDHLGFYCPQDRKPLAEFSWRGTGTRELTEIGTGTVGLDALVADVAAVGSDVIVCDLTTPDVAELGLAVVRVVAPRLHPLQMGHTNRCLGGSRLATVPVAAGVAGWSPDQDNPYPHPFP